ncbi:MAG: hypothetical protein P1V97_00985 [Planctomycetota bacterium]|nr:hypothetical protein [Planctomycetota bacterium]
MTQQEPNWHPLKNKTLLEQLEWSSDGLKAVVSHARLLACELGLHAVNAEHIILGILEKAPESEASRALLGQSVTSESVLAYAKRVAGDSTLKEWRGDWLHPDIDLDGGDFFEFSEDSDSSEEFTPDMLYRILWLSEGAQARLAEIGVAKAS